MDLRELLCGLRDCSTRYVFHESAARAGTDGKPLRKLQDAFFRAEALDDRLMRGLSLYLDKARPAPEQVASVLALQAAQPSLLSDLRDPSLAKALEAADRVVKAWVEPAPAARRREAWRDLCFGATFLLRCVAPTRFPIVSVPEDLLAGRTTAWRTLEQFLSDYRGQVRAAQRVARYLGILDPMRLHDGIQQFSRCQSSTRERCQGVGKDLPACAGWRLRESGDEGPMRRRHVLARVRALLQLHAVAKAGSDLGPWIDEMLPSPADLAYGLQALHHMVEQARAEGGSRTVAHNLLVALEKALRVRLVEAGREVVRGRQAVAQAERAANAPEGELSQFPSSGREGEQRPVLVTGPRPAGVGAAPREPSAREVAEAIFTPKSTVDRLMRLSDTQALERARRRRTRRR